MYWLALLVAVAVSAAYLAYCLPQRGWVPHDDGALGESAVRVLHGELPHRDFAEVYTGGLAYLDAAAFRLFGTNTMTTRWVLFLFVVPTIAAMFYVLSRFVSPWTAAACTTVAVIWSFAAYTAAMPSWYNLLFAILAIAAVLRYLDVRNRGWLFAAGMCAGLSFDIKLPGVYLLAALLLFLIYEEQSTAASDRGNDRRYLLLLTAALIAALVVLLAVVRRVEGMAVLYHFFLPLAAVSALVAAHEPCVGTPAYRVKRTFRLWWPVLLGILAAIAPMIFLMRHALRAWLYGVFILPQARFYTTTTRVPPPLWVAAAALPVVLVLAAAVFYRSRITTLASIAFAGALGIALLKASDTFTYMAGTYPFWMLTSPAVVLGCAAVWWRRRDTSALHSNRVVLVLCVLAACLLVQFPFTVIIYFCYITPLLMFAIAATMSLMPRGPHPVIAGALLAFLGLHGALFFGPNQINFKPDLFGPDYMVPLELQRAGGLKIPVLAHNEFQPAIEFLQAHALGGYTYCALDCPDVYFYSGLRNPTPILYDDFDDPRGRNDRIMAALERHSVTAVFLEPSLFLGTVPRDLADELARRYPNARQFGKIQVRWR